MRESDKKWEFVCRLDSIQNTEHVNPEVYAKTLENVGNDISKHLMERPFDQHFIIEKKS